MPDCIMVFWKDPAKLLEFNDAINGNELDEMFCHIYSAPVSDEYHFMAWYNVILGTLATHRDSYKLDGPEIRAYVNEFSTEKPDYKYAEYRGCLNLILDYLIEEVVVYRFFSHKDYIDQRTKEGIEHMIETAKKQLYGKEQETAATAE